MAIATAFFLSAGACKHQQHDSCNHTHQRSSGVAVQKTAYKRLQCVCTARRDFVTATLQRGGWGGQTTTPQISMEIAAAFFVCGRSSHNH